MNLEDVEGENDDDILGSHMEIQIEAANLANMDVFSLSDPFALLEASKGEKWSEIGKLISFCLMKLIASDLFFLTFAIYIRGHAEKK